MTSRIYLKCNLCGAVTILRYQVGYSGTQIVLPCGSCCCEMRGSCSQNDENVSLAFEFDNATILSQNVTPDYVGQYSRELLSEKVKPYTSEGEMSLSPFIAMRDYFLEHKSDGRLQSAMRFVENSLPQSNDMFDLIKLWGNEKLTLLAKKLDDILPSPPISVHNHLQVSMRLHSLFVVYLSPLMPTGWFERDEFFPLITSLNKEQPMEIIRCAKFFETNGYFTKCEKSLYEIIRRFLPLVPNILPAFSLCDGNITASCLEERGMYTISFEDLKSFYQNSYEIIANCTDCLIALNGIKYRKDFSALEKSIGEIKTVFDLEKCRSKIKKIENFLSENEVFSKLIAEPLHSHIRNAIGHSEVSYDPLTQIIIFEDKSNGKINREEKYLVEFAKICIENFCTCVYLLEIVYQLRKIAFINDGDTPDAEYMNFFLKQAHRKVGRNEPCPCGSGKKYKRCCGR